LAHISLEFSRLEWINGLPTGHRQHGASIVCCLAVLYASCRQPRLVYLLNPPTFQRCFLSSLSLSSYSFTSTHFYAVAILCMYPSLIIISLDPLMIEHPRRHLDWFSHFCRGHGRDQQRDRQTDKQTDRQTAIHVAIVRSDDAG